MTEKENEKQTVINNKAKTSLKAYPFYVIFNIMEKWPPRRNTYIIATEALGLSHSLDLFLLHDLLCNHVENTDFRHFNLFLEVFLHPVRQWRILVSQIHQDQLMTVLNTL